MEIAAGLRDRRERPKSEAVERKEEGRTGSGLCELRSTVLSMAYLSEKLATTL